MSIKKHIAFCFFLFSVLWGSAQPALWREASGADSSLRAVPADGPLVYRMLQIDSILLGTGMFDAPADTFELLIPLPEGGFSPFQVWPSGVMAPALADLFPGIVALAGKGGGGAWLRMESTPLGISVMVHRPEGDFFIEPLPGMPSPYYLEFNRREMQRQKEWDCQVKEMPGLDFREERSPPFPGDSLRTYRLAVAATGEYSQYHGGTVEGALGAIVTTINRINGIFERDLSIRLQLVEGNEQLIFLDPDTDPYSNNNEKRENQEVVDGYIGSRNYDVGHVFGIAARGSVSIAEIASVCDEETKAMGSSRLEDPAGDAFDVDRVAHELGHQFGATHTFNKCGDQQGDLPVEPGSGSTIMTWAGICGENDLQLNSDPYFHGSSIGQIMQFVSNGGDCAVKTPTGNNIPEVTPELSRPVIPVNTPFELQKSVSDRDGDRLFYTWEEIDQGPSTPVGSPQGAAPMFRSWPPAADPIRVFPRWEDLLQNQTAFGEVLPFYSRTLNFQLTVRDGRGGVAWDSLQIGVAGQAGPFRVSSQNVPGEIFEGGDLLEVTWTVAGTDLAPVSASSVDILLLPGSGRSDPIILAKATPNDGVEEVLLPDTLNGDAYRLKVKASGNVFFDINDADFSIRPGATSVDPLPGQITGLTVFPNPAGEETTLSFRVEKAGSLDLHLYAGDGRKLHVYRMGAFQEGVRSLSLPLSGLPAGLYYFYLALDGNRTPATGRFVKH